MLQIYCDGPYYRWVHGERTVNTSNTKLASSLRERVRSLIESARFERSITALIVANAITLGIETSPPVAARFGDSLYAFDRLVLAVFVVELLLRFFVYRGRFFGDPWRVFDFVIVGIAVVPAGSAFAVLRALRVLRVLRVVSLVPSMRRVIGALLNALPGMASIVGLLGLVLYVFAVLATKLYAAIAPEFFGNLGTSLFTLFQVMTVEGWPDVARSVMTQSPHSWIFFVVYLLIATFMVFKPVHCGGRQSDAVPGDRRPQGRGRSAHPVDPRRGTRVAAGDRGAAWAVAIVTSYSVRPTGPALSPPVAAVGNQRQVM